MFEAITGGYKTKVNVENDQLVLSYPDANIPGLSRIDLDKGDLSFSIAQDKDLHQLLLGKKVVATYDKRSKAVKTLVKINKALKKKHEKSGFFSIILKIVKWIAIITGLAFILVFTYAFFFLFLFSNNYEATTNTRSYIEKQLAVPKEENPKRVAPRPKAGAPIDADDFLNSLKEK